jgi:hypothetical protein
MIGGLSRCHRIEVSGKQRRVISVDLDEFLIFVNPLKYTDIDTDQPPNPTKAKSTLSEESWNNMPKPEKDDK